MADPATARVLEPGERRSLITPEGIDLSLGLGSGGQRVGAFMIDVMIMLVALTILTVLLQWIAGAGGLAATEVALAVWLLGAFLIRNFYFIVFEAGKRAATLGKRAVGLRVVAQSGERLTMESVVARNLMREIEVFLPLTYLVYASLEGGSAPGLGLAGAGWILLFVLFPLFNRDRLRVGDLLAGTWVITVPKRRLSYDLVAQGPPAGTISFTPEQLDAYGVYELQTLERVLRDDQLETVRTVAATIRNKIRYWEPGDDYDFLTAYYAAARAHLERGLLFGRRKLDKFDRGD